MNLSVLVVAAVIAALTPPEDEDAVVRGSFVARLGNDVVAVEFGDLTWLQGAFDAD